MSIREIVQNFHNFLLPPLSEFSHCFCPNFSIAFARISGKSNGKFGQKSNGKFGQKLWENWDKSNEKKRRHIFRAKNYCSCPHFPLLLPEFSIAFSRISHCFCPNFLLLLPRISHCFCLNFSFSNFFGGHSAPPPPPASYAYAPPYPVEAGTHGNCLFFNLCFSWVSTD